MYKDKQYVVVTLREAEAKRIAEEQVATGSHQARASRGESGGARACPRHASSDSGTRRPGYKPVTSHVVEQVALQASVTDFEALIKAVAYGQAPVTLLLVNWEALDAMVAAQGANFSMAGVTLGKAAA